MAKRVPTPEEIAAAQAAVERIMPMLEKLERISPTTLELVEYWCDRLIAGESIEEIRPEMDRLLALYRKNRP